MFDLSRVNQLFKLENHATDPDVQRLLTAFANADRHLLTEDAAHRIAHHLQIEDCADCRKVLTAIRHHREFGVRSTHFPARRPAVNTFNR